MLEENKNLVRFDYEEILNKKNLDAIEQIFTGDTLFRAPNMPEARGYEGRRQLVLAIYKAFPDICYTIQDLIAENDKVVAHWSVTGTHKGEWLGVKAAGRTLSSSGISIFRISEGKIAEELVQFDGLGTVQQLSPPRSPRRSKPKSKAKTEPKKKAKVAKTEIAPKAKKRAKR